MRVSYWWQRQIKRVMFHQLKGQIPRRTITPSITDYMDEPIAIAFLQSKGILPETAKRCHIGFDKNWINPTIVKRCQESASAFHSVCVPTPMSRLIIPISKNSYIARTVFSDSQAPYYNVGHAGLFLPDTLYNGQKAVFVTEDVFDALSSFSVVETLWHLILQVIWHFWLICCRKSRRKQPFFWHSTTINLDGRQARSYNRS